MDQKVHFLHFTTKKCSWRLKDCKTKRRECILQIGGEKIWCLWVLMILG